jgi:hypothetical protein
MLAMDTFAAESNIGNPKVSVFADHAHISLHNQILDGCARHKVHNLK